MRVVLALSPDADSRKRSIACELFQKLSPLHHRVTLTTDRKTDLVTCLEALGKKGKAVYVPIAAKGLPDESFQRRSSLRVERHALRRAQKGTIKRTSYHVQQGRPLAIFTERRPVQLT